MTAIPASVRPFRLGVHLTEGGADVAVFASHATAVELCLIAPAAKATATSGRRAPALAPAARGLGLRRRCDQAQLDRSGVRSEHGDVRATLGEMDAEPERTSCCLLYTSDAADDLLCVDLGGRRI